MNGRFQMALLSGGLLVLTCGCKTPPAASRTAGVNLDNGHPDKVVLGPGSPKLRQLRVVAAAVLDVPGEAVTAPGKVEVNPNRVSRVLMPVAGLVRSVDVKLGDAVSEGQVLLTVQSPEAASAFAALSQAEARLRQARSALAKAEKDLARIRSLFEHRAAAQKDVTAAENDLVQAQAEVQSADADVRQADERLQVLGLRAGSGARDVAVRAPIAGKVLEIAVTPGEYRTDTAASLMTIADLSTVWVSSNVPESSIRLIELNEPVDIALVAYPGETFHGRVTRIADSVDPETRTLKVQAELANPHGRFRPEMFGNIFHSHGARKLPAVPSGAVLLNGQGAFVYRELSAGVFEKNAVKLGALLDGYYPVVEGLRPGDRVVADGALLLTLAR